MVAQFNVATAHRYAPRDSATFCNIFAWDVTSAMGCEVPHWVDSEGHPAKMGPPNHELDINEALAWLRSTGPHPYGWREVDAVEAELQASAGHPTLVVLREQPHGHVAVVMPSRPGTPGLRVSQAGARCFTDEPLSHGFGSKGPLHFFSHP